MAVTTERMTELRDRLEQEYETTSELRKLCEGRLKASLPKGFPFELIESYAAARTREILALRALDGCGWGRE